MPVFLKNPTALRAGRGYGLSPGRRLPRWLRAVAIAALLTTAAVLAVVLLAPPRVAVDLIPVPRVALPAGHMVTPADIDLAPFPPDALPSTVLRAPSLVTGQVTTREIAAGLPLTAPDVRADLRHMSHGEAITYVPLPSAEFGRLLTPGSHLKLAFPPGSPAETLSSCNAPVVVIFGAGESAAPDGSLISEGNTNSKSVIIKTTETCAAALAFIADMSMIRVVLVPEQDSLLLNRQTSDSFP